MEQINFSELLVLNDEYDLSLETKIRRIELLDKFLCLPVEVFAKIRHFQPQVGCFNKCSFCSQGAISKIVEFDIESIRDIVAAIKATVITKRENKCVLTHQELIKHPLIAYEADRKGVVYCYLDNDPALYRELDEFIKILYENLGVKTRISTVGFSRHNQLIDLGFRNISKMIDIISGLRLSISPYTLGWKDNKKTSKDDFEEDIAYFIKLFKTEFESNNERFSVELRNKPFVKQIELEYGTYKNHFYIKVSKSIYISKNINVEMNIAKLQSYESRNLSLDYQGIEVYRIDTKHLDEALNAISTLSFVSKHKLHFLENEDGIYFGIDVERTNNGSSFAKYYYPITEKRKQSGYLDGERYLLNSLLEFKPKDRKASWNDVDNVISDLRLIVKLRLEEGDIDSSKYIEYHILPLVESYIRILKKSGVAPNNFFSKKFTIDTGHICNLGFAYNEYRLIASRSDMPVTLNHERTFGKNGDLAKEGVVYRLAPSVNERVSSKKMKVSNRVTSSFIIEKLNLEETSDKNGQSESKYVFDLDGINSVKLDDYEEAPIPGQIKVMNI